MEIVIFYFADIWWLLPAKGAANTHAARRAQGEPLKRYTCNGDRKERQILKSLINNKIWNAKNRLQSEVAGNFGFYSVFWKYFITRPNKLFQQTKLLRFLSVLQCGDDNRYQKQQQQQRLANIIGRFSKQLLSSAFISSVCSSTSFFPLLLFKAESHNAETHIEWFFFCIFRISLYDNLDHNEVHQIVFFSISFSYGFSVAPCKRNERTFSYAL